MATPRQAAHDLGDDNGVALAGPFGLGRGGAGGPDRRREREKTNCAARWSPFAARLTNCFTVASSLVMRTGWPFSVASISSPSALATSARSGLPSSAARADCRTGRGGSGWRAAAGDSRFSRSPRRQEEVREPCLLIRPRRPPFAKAGFGRLGRRVGAAEFSISAASEACRPPSRRSLSVGDARLGAGDRGESLSLRVESGAFARRRLPSPDGGVDGEKGRGVGASPQTRRCGPSAQASPARAAPGCDPGGGRALVAAIASRPTRSWVAPDAVHRESGRSPILRRAVDRRL